MLVNLLLLQLLAYMPATISGNVTDAMSGLPVPLANIALADKQFGSASNEDGFFRIDRLAAGRYSVIASHVSFLPETLGIAIEPGTSIRLEFRLRPAPVEIPTVTVSAERAGRTEDVTVRVVTGDELRERAGGFVQDPVRSLSFMPGVAHSGRGEWSGQYVVRGGDPDENRLWFDNIEPLWPYHLLGFSSIINPDIVSGIEFYPTVFPIRYGGALSSVTIIRPVRSSPAEGVFAYDPMNLKASYAGTVDDIEVLTSLRRTFYYVQFGPTGAGRDNQPTYSDLALQLGIPLGNQHRARVSILNGSDRIVSDLRGTWSELTESGRTVAATLESEFGRVRTEIVGWYSDHRFSLAPTRWQGFGSTTENEIGIRLQVATAFNDIDLSGGLQYGRARFAGNLLEPEGFGRSDLISAGWLDARYRLGSRTAVDLGIRSEAVRWAEQRSFDPRAVLSYRLTPGAVLRGGWRRVHQHPYSFLRRSVASMVFDNEYGDYEMFRVGGLNAKSADHYSLAGELALGPDIRLDLEGYIKDYSRLPTWHEDSLGGRFAFGSDGFGLSRGMELAIETRPVSGWSGQLSYGLAWSRKQQGLDTMPYWDEYDRRHILNVIAMKQWPGDWQLAANFSFHTGSPYTPLTYYLDGSETGTLKIPRRDAGRVVRGEKNSLRVPTYHRLDLKLQKQLSHLPLKPFFYIEVLNIYNHENVYDLVQFETSTGDIRTGRFTGIQFIPLIGMGGRF